MTLRSFIDDAGPPTQTIAVVSEDASGSGPLEEMLAETFEDQPIAVEADVTLDGDTDAPPAVADALAADGDTAVLLEDGEPVAASPMLKLYDSLLAINSDLFVTGARGVGEIEFPDVLAGLEGTRLRLRGYPLAHKEKLLLILVSRHIEQRAWAAGSGTLHSAFQDLSRIDDEIGTYETYDALADTDVDVHVYGAESGGDGATTDLDVTEHTGTDAAYRDGWFVVFEPDDRAPADAEGCALVCLETEPRIWHGFWTTDPQRVTRIESYVAREL
ncbi:DICT sensory domain-containing protein [Natrinema sp. 1APR25-10V2]|uniref:DICT sensory domain-containing protein n=1 Tax=Natrinema sp. 1APR25-10V2 TaxID=2951081 RepID=UPI0028750199|nr:DICT sensory domain-containing protein [Natrinema sp. 1APR25-10V2]MDS0475767.1 histidine kinase [Natrinema sp. 1APR25-10V2]